MLVGITGALRGFSPNFFWLALTTFFSVCVISPSY
jgi:hypothetical protein